jgi:hypothetical protein
MPLMYEVRLTHSHELVMICPLPTLAQVFNLTPSQMRDVELGQLHTLLWRTLRYLPAPADLLTIGSIAGPFGTLVGGVIGAAVSAISSAFGGGRNDAETLNWNQADLLTAVEEGFVQRVQAVTVRRMPLELSSPPASGLRPTSSVCTCEGKLGTFRHLPDCPLAQTAQGQVENAQGRRLSEPTPAKFSPRGKAE